MVLNVLILLTVRTSLKVNTASLRFLRCIPVAHCEGEGSRHSHTKIQAEV